MGIIHVATATDRSYLPYVAAMVSSLDASMGPSTRVELTVLHSGVVPHEQRQIERAAPRVGMHWVEMTADRYLRYGVEPDPLVLTPHYFRCLLPATHPADVGRVIYLDADTLVLEDLSALWAWPLGGHPVAAATDLMTVVGDAIDHWREIGLDGDAPYFNSGVMVIDLERWRAEDIGTRVLDRCKADRHRLLIRGRWNQHDQYGFNVVLQHRWARLDDRWNHFVERPSEAPAILHFLGDTKPGAPRARPEFTDLFHRAVDATAWAGWRPPPAAVHTKFVRMP